MPRLFSTALLLALLGATGFAFVITEGLKLEPSPVTKVFVTKIFSPTCECQTDFALIHFRLRKADRVTLAILGKGNRLVRTLVGPANASLRLKWKVEWQARGRPGKYRLTVAARDVAGNLSNATPPVAIVIPLRVLTQRVQVRSGSRFAVRIQSDGRAYFWQLGNRGGFASGRTLVLRAPPKPGRYTLVIRQDRLPHRVPVTVKR